MKYRKISQYEKDELEEIEETYYNIMEDAINNINNSCGTFAATLSPNVATIQMHLNVFENRDKDDIKLASNGFMNYNLCLNAETEQPHTECDCSYTIIAVPNQMLKYKLKTKKNSSSFQLIINPDCTVVLPMTIGTMFTYSGYLITHHQQVRYKDFNEKPFVNIVSYGSK